jgi:hypothetical protein
MCDSRHGLREHRAQCESVHRPEVFLDHEAEESFGGGEHSGYTSDSFGDEAFPKYSRFPRREEKMLGRPRPIDYDGERKRKHPKADGQMKNGGRPKKKQDPTVKIGLFMDVATRQAVAARLYDVERGLAEIRQIFGIPSHHPNQGLLRPPQIHSSPHGNAF